MSEEESSCEAAQVGPSPKVVACNWAVMKELLDKCQDDSVESTLEGGSGSMLVDPPSTLTGEQWNCFSFT